MHRKGKLKRDITEIIQDAEFTYEEKEVWQEIFSHIADYQEDCIQKIATDAEDENPKFWNIQCGITCLDEKKLGKNKNFISISDDIRDQNFPYGDINSENKPTSKKDGDWFIIGTGYLDCEYDELYSICGRDISYIGHTSDGKEFEYSLILQNNILHREKMLYYLVDFYNISDPVIYAPMLRRLVYIETKSKITSKITEMDLMLEKNNLQFLRGGWRAFWNIEINDNPYGQKNINNRITYNYALEQGEFIIPEEKYENKIHLLKKYNREKEQEYIEASSDSIENLKECLYKVKVFSINSDQEIIQNNLIAYCNFGCHSKDVNRIKSKSDIFKYLKHFSNMVELHEIHTIHTKPNDMKICAYEFGFEYPIYPTYFYASDRPKIFLVFKNDHGKFLFDRIVYVVHVMQRVFPEYIWKGGYIK